MALLVVACARYPKDLMQVLELAGDNRQELEKVLEHYQNLGDAEKLKAARFLISNMEGKGFYEGGIIDAYQPLFQKIDSLKRAGASLEVRTGVMEKEWVQLVKTVGAPSQDKSVYYPDIQHLTAEFLIASIDHAFMLRDSLSWCRQLKKSLFYEYILPYRVRRETPHDWRTHLYGKMRAIRDSVNNDNAKGLAAIVNPYINTYIETDRTLWEYPFDFEVEQIEGMGVGACPHRVVYTVMAMRANGIATAMDYSPQWANMQGGHYWAVYMDNKHHYPYDAAYAYFGFEYQQYRKFAKVFRMTFKRTAGEFPVHQDIPKRMIERGVDVTQEYTATTDIVVPVPEMIDKEYALIGTFNNRNWIPQHAGRIKSGKAVFKNMGKGIVYIIMSHDGGRLQTVGEPFIVDTLGHIRYLKANEEKTCDMTVYRKFPLIERIEKYMSWVIGGRFVGSNLEGLQDTVLLYEITRRPEHFETAIIHDPRTFRYLRYIALKPRQEQIAELEFYGLAENGIDTVQLEGKIIGYPEPEPESKTNYTIAFDGNTGNYFIGRVKHPWVGMDFGKPQRIVKIRYCPRSDTNFIEPGDTYELFYWIDDDWESAGKRVATQPFLTYKNIPSGALYILRNYTKGKEERIFTYENGKQIWW